MDLKSCTWQSPYINLLANFNKKKDEFISQDLVKKLKTGNNKTLTFLQVLNFSKAFTSFEVSILPLVSFFTSHFFIKFIKAFIKSI